MYSFSPGRIPGIVSLYFFTSSPLSRPKDRPLFFWVEVRFLFLLTFNGVKVTPDRGRRFFKGFFVHFDFPVVLRLCRANFDLRFFDLRICEFSCVVDFRPVRAKTQPAAGVALVLFVRWVWAIYTTGHSLTSFPPGPEGAAPCPSGRSRCLLSGIPRSVSAGSDTFPGRGHRFGYGPGLAGFEGPSWTGSS